MQDANDSADDSARHGQNQEKQKAPTTELKIFLSTSCFDGNYQKGKNPKTSGVLARKTHPNGSMEGIVQLHGYSLSSAKGVTSNISKIRSLGHPGPDETL